MGKDVNTVQFGSAPGDLGADTQLAYQGEVLVVVVAAECAAGAQRRRRVSSE